MRESIFGGRKMMTKFITFRTEWEYDDRRLVNVSRDATLQLNEWLEANPNVEIIDWRPFTVGTGTDYYITVQYKEN
jgi:hypothetical protein